jgi:dipeptidyl aminopeptidase/acylaminoacyl peptidase
VTVPTRRNLSSAPNPLNSIERIDAPLFVLHGENDPRVPVGEAEQVAARVEEGTFPSKP